MNDSQNAHSNNQETFISLSRSKTTPNSSSENDSCNQATLYSNYFKRLNMLKFPPNQDKKTVFTSSNSNGKSQQNTFISTGIPNDNYRHSHTHVGNSVMKSNMSQNNFMVGNSLFGNNFLGNNFFANNVVDPFQRPLFIGQQANNNLIPCQSQASVYLSQNASFSNGLFVNQTNNAIGDPLFIEQKGSSGFTQPASYNNVYMIMPGGLVPFTK